MIDDIIERLKSHVPELHSVEGATALEQIVRTGKPSQKTPGAVVFPLGVTGQRADAATSVFTQPVTETVGVMLMVRSTDRLGERALDELRPLVKAVIEAVAGWAPMRMPGVFELRRGSLLSMVNNTAFYQLDFAVNDQLRIQS